jgi:16S rRNA (cytidine1402-2'-O)-methyltransferase
MNHRKTPLTAGLYLVATPIGSARDITLRSLDILASCDLIVAEDTRTARKLLDIHGVPLNGRRMIAYHDHSGENSVQGIVKLIAEGKSVAYVSEAGTPLVADPGFELGREVIAQGLTVTAAPGASAVLAALTVSGLPTDRFMFAGFLPAARAQRQTEIAALRDMPLTMIFYESPKRIQEMLEDLREILGGSRDVAVCRELTKKFEEVTRGTLDEVIEAYDGRSVKGELVVLVGRAGATDVEEMDVETALRQAMETMRVKDAATAVAGALGLPKRQVYQIALGLSKED